VLNRLLEAQAKNSGGSVISDVQDAYDGAGNRTSQSGTGGTVSYTYNAANELTAAGNTTFSYDANGNETGNSAGLAFGYNAKDQTNSLTPPGGSALAQSYTGATQIQRVTEASTTFKYSTLGAMSQADGSGTTFYTRDNTGLLVGERLPGGTRFYYLYDGLGNVVALTDSSGNVVNTYSYEPYGKTTTSTGANANPWRFGGSYGAYTENSASGLLKIGQRFYDPSLGRWTQQDPVLQWNRYVYVACNPINGIDPSGMDCASATAAFALALLSGRER